MVIMVPEQGGGSHPDCAVAGMGARLLPPKNSVGTDRGDKERRLCILLAVQWGKDAEEPQPAGPESFGDTDCVLGTQASLSPSSSPLGSSAPWRPAAPGEGCFPKEYFPREGYLGSASSLVCLYLFIY